MASIRAREEILEVLHTDAVDTSKVDWRVLTFTPFIKFIFKHFIQCK